MTSMLMWYSENCFEAWSAHLLPQTGHDLGMKSCMTGMHGFHNLFRVKRWSVLGFGAICCQSTSGPLVAPHSDMDLQGTSHCWSSSKQLGHYDSELLQVSAFGRLLLDRCPANGAVPILGGDFNASTGILLGGPGDEDDDVDLLGDALVAEMKKAHGLCNGYFQMGCASASHWSCLPPRDEMEHSQVETAYQNSPAVQTCTSPAY